MGTDYECISFHTLLEQRPTQYRRYIRREVETLLKHHDPQSIVEAPSPDENPRENEPAAVPGFASAAKRTGGWGFLFGSGFIIQRVVKEEWFAWPGYNWVGMRINLTEELRDLADDIWREEAATGIKGPGHHLGVQILGQADIRRVTLTME